MGDRAQVFVKDGSEGVYLYTHWLGTELPALVAAALDSKQGRARWTDPPYLARIIFGHMLDGDDPMAETGYGIAATLTDGKLLTVNVDAQHVTTYDGYMLTFEEFINRYKIKETS